MKNLFPFIATGALAFLAYRFLRKGVAAKTLNIKLRTVKVRPISQAAIVLDVINPTNTAINISSVVADILINDFPISTVNYQQPTVIPANGSVSISLRIKINPLEAGQFLLRLLSSAGRKLNKIRLTGTVSGEGIVAPINIEQNLTL